MRFCPSYVSSSILIRTNPGCHKSRGPSVSRLNSSMASQYSSIFIRNSFGGVQSWLIEHHKLSPVQMLLTFVMDAFLDLLCKPLTCIFTWYSFAFFVHWRKLPLGSLKSEMRIHQLIRKAHRISEGFCLSKKMPATPTNHHHLPAVRTYDPATPLPCSSGVTLCAALQHAALKSWVTESSTLRKSSDTSLQIARTATVTGISNPEMLIPLLPTTEWVNIFLCQLCATDFMWQVLCLKLQEHWVLQQFAVLAGSKSSPPCDNVRSSYKAYLNFLCTSPVWT